MVENPMSYSEVFTRSGHNFKEKVTRYEGLVRLRRLRMDLTGAGFDGKMTEQLESGKVHESTMSNSSQSWCEIGNHNFRSALLTGHN